MIPIIKTKPPITPPPITPETVALTPSPTSMKYAGHTILLEYAYACSVRIKGRHALKWGMCSNSNTEQQYSIQWQDIEQALVSS